MLACEKLTMSTQNNDVGANKLTWAEEVDADVCKTRC